MTFDFDLYLWKCCSHQTYWKGGEEVGEGLADEHAVLPVDQLGVQFLISMFKHNMRIELVLWCIFRGAPTPEMSSHISLTPSNLSACIAFKFIVPLKLIHSVESSLVHRSQEMMHLRSLEMCS